MIEKPVSRIFNVKGIYDVNNSSKTLSDLTFSSGDKGKIVVVNKSTGYVVNYHSGMQYLDVKTIGDVDIFCVTGDAKKPLMKFPGNRSFRYGDIHNINITNSKTGVDFYAKVYGYTYCCGGEYGLRFEVINDELYMQQYPNRYVESYMVEADECCKDCGGNTVGVVDDNVITQKLYKKIKLAHDSGASMLTPYMVVEGDYKLYDSTQATNKYLQKDGSYNSTQPAESKALCVALGLGDDDGDLSEDTNLKNKSLTADQISAVITWNNALTTGGSPIKTSIVVKCEPSEKYTYGMFNLKYVKNRATTMRVAPISGMVCTGNFISNSDENYSSGDITIGSTAIGAYVVEETSGYDLNRVDFEEMGWMDESPYRMSSVTGTEFGHKYQFEDDKKYDLMTISYEQISDAAWGHFQHPLEVALAVDSDDTNNVFRDLERLFTVVAYNANKLGTDKNINLK